MLDVVLYIVKFVALGNAGNFYILFHDNLPHILVCEETGNEDFDNWDPQHCEV
jgi:hypothetical protein